MNAVTELLELMDERYESQCDQARNSKSLVMIKVHMNSATIAKQSREDILKSDVIKITGE